MLLWRDPSLFSLRVAVAVIGAVLVLTPQPGLAAGPALAAQGQASLAKASPAEKVAPAGDKKAPPAPEKAPPAADKAPPAAAKAPAEPTAEELEPAPRVPAAAFVYEAAGVEPEQAQRLEAALLAALRGDRRLALIDLRESLDPAEPGQVALSRVQEQLEQARGLIEGKKASQASKMLDQAVATLLRELGHVGTLEGVADTLREALGLQASVAFIEGDQQKAQALLQAVYNIDRRLRWVSRLFPESMKDFVEQARTQFVNSTRGALQLGSSPGGAQIYVGGKKAGQGRATAEALPPGPHYVTWTRRNRRALTSRVVLQPGQTTELSPALPRYGADDPIARLEAAEAQLGKAEMPLGVTEAAVTLRADLLVLLRPQAPEKGSMRVTAYLYDRRLRTLLNKAQGSASAEAPERDLPKLVTALFTDAKLDGQPKLVEKPLPPPVPPAPTGFEKVVRAKWFWPVLGSVAGVIVTAAIVDAAVRAR